MIKTALQNSQKGNTGFVHWSPAFMRVHNLKTLREFWGKHKDAEGALRVWFKTAEEASWSSFSDLRKSFGTADVIRGNRAVVNIKGNKYRLVLKINYDWKIAYIRFIGTHADYDRIDAETV